MKPNELQKLSSPVLASEYVQQMLEAGAPPRETHSPGIGG
jgi:hypothetical protein